jgi:SAM-dependent methyltransferase
MLKKIYKTIFTERQRNDFYYFLFQFRALRYQGNAVKCNCCENEFSMFLAYGNEKRENAACPKCNALERNRVLWMYLEKELTIRHKNWRVLHFAPERTLEKKLKSLSNLTYFGVDINPQLADYQVDIIDIPYKENTFDLIICSHVLGHVPDEAKAIQELKRVLAPSGLAIILTVININNKDTYENPNVKTPLERLAHYGEDDLLRLHGMDFGQRLANQGFQVERLDYRLTFSEADQQRFGLGRGEREVLYLCKK